ncbi:hypothetical protein Tco_0276687 [Tanacetum coccineum]
MSLSLAENVIVAGTDNRRPMLDKTNYSLWESCMLFYIKGKEHCKLLVDLVLNGPFQYETIIEPGNETTPTTVRARTYIDLTDEEKIRKSVDIKETNIVLQGIKQPFKMEESLCRQFRGDRHKDMLTMGQGTLLQIMVLMGKGLQCTKLKRPKNSTWFKEKMLLTEALESGPYLDPEQLAFLADNGDIAILMANLSSYDSDVLSKVPFHDTNIENDMSYHSVQETQRSKQPSLNNDTEVGITSDSNIICYEQYLQETDNPVVQDTSSSAQQEELLMYIIEEMSSQVVKCNKVIVDRNAKVADLEKKIHSLILQLNATVESPKTLSTTIECLKKESKQKKDKYLDEVIDLQNKNKALDNVVYKMGSSMQTMHMLTKSQAFYDESHKNALGYQNPFYLSQARRKVPALCDGHTIVKTHVALSVTDTEETLELAEENKKYFEIEKKELSLDNDRLLEHIICQDVTNTIMHANDHFDNVSCAYCCYSLAAINDYKSMQQSFMDEYNETLVLKAELAKKHDIIEKAVYNELLKRCSRLENQCISLEIKLQQSKESRTNHTMYLDSGCSKHMTRKRSQLIKFVSKFLGTVRFGNDQIAKIMGFGDYQLGNVTISRVYYVEGLGHNLFSVD